MLDQEMGVAGCATEGAECQSELRWLDFGLRTVFGRTLKEVYPLFVDAFSLFGEHRIAGIEDAGRFEEGNGWRDAVFESCPPVAFSPGRFPTRHRQTVRTIEPVSAHCWTISPWGFPDHDRVRVAVTVDERAGTIDLSDLSASVGGHPTWADTAFVESDGETGVRHATWVYELDVDSTVVFLLSNVAEDPGASSRIHNLVVTFTLLESFATLGAETAGPGPAEIDQPLPLKVDAFPMAEVMPYTAPHSGEALNEPCAVRLRMRNSQYGDEIGLQMDREGPLRPGEYVVAPVPYGEMGSRSAPGWWPNQFYLTFGIGAGNPLSGGKRQGFTGDGGTVKIESVTAGVLRGTLRATGWRCMECRSIDEEPFGYPNLAIRAEFSVATRDLVRRARLGRDAPPGSDCLTSTQREPDASPPGEP